MIACIKHRGLLFWEIETTHKQPGDIDRRGSAHALENRQHDQWFHDSIVALQTMYGKQQYVVNMAFTFKTVHRIVSFYHNSSHL